MSSKDGGKYRDSSLFNLNPAPKNMSPPDYVPGATPLLDDAYLTSQADFHFTMGETFGYEGQSPKAIEEYKLTLIYDPKSVHVRLRLAQEYVRMGMITEAVEQAEIGVDMAPTSVEARMLLGGLYSGLKMFDPARAQFEEVIKFDETNAEAAIFLGALLAEDRKYDEAIQYFERLTKNPKFKEPERAYYYIGRVYAEQGQTKYSEAQKAFSQALKQKPEYPEAALALGMLYRAQSKDEDMVKLLKSYQEKFGPEREMARQLSHYFLEKEDFDRALEQLEFIDGFERDNLNVKIQISLILIEQKKYEAAAQRLEDVLAQAPESDKVRYYLGAVYEEIGKPQLAILHYKEIGPASNYFAEAVVHTAHLQKGLNQLDQAVQTVERAIAKQEDVPQLYAYYATLLDEKKNYKQAVTMLTGAVQRFPASTQLHFFLGTMHDRVGEPKKTITQMLKVLDLDKDHVQALNYLAYTYAEIGNNLDEAASLATRALDLQPNDGYILDTVGWIHFKKGENETAIKYLELAVKAKPDEAIISEHLGDAYLRFQMWQKAQKMYQKAAELESDNIRSRKILEKIANVNSQLQTPSRMPASVPEPRAQ
jgi:tetratricopeptide (TPR) repeat protein